MDIVGRVLLGITHGMRGSKSLRALREIKATPSKSAQDVFADQFLHLSSLLALAEAKVPYYREMFRTLGIRSSDIRSLEDFSRLPYLTKDIIRERSDALLVEDVHKADLLRGQTGGSTGVPLRFYFDRSAMDLLEAGTFRAFTQCGWQPGEMVAFLWGGYAQLYAMSPWEFELRQHIRRQYQFDSFDSGPEEMDRWLIKWRKIKPRVAFGYASMIARFASHIEARGMKVDPLKGVFTTAEKLYAPQRETLSRVFGCHVYDFYGSSEVSNIACECPRGRMHVNADMVVLEVDRSGGAGQPCPFIVTSLCNRVMPFLRYRNEDCGDLEEGSCDCGNHFPLMHLDIARLYDDFILPDGRFVHGHFFTRLMERSEGVAMFQFHQTSPDSITLWIVPGYGNAQERQLAVRTAVQKVEQLDPLGRLKVQVRETTKIPLSSAGKHRFTLSDVRAAQKASTARSEG